MYYLLCIPCAGCLAQSSCSCQLDWLGCSHAAAHQVEALTAGHCLPRAFSSNPVNSASPPPVLTSATCTEVPAWRSLAGGCMGWMTLCLPSNCRRVYGGTASVAEIWCNECP